MGLIKISQLPNQSLSNVSDNDYIAVVDIPPSGTTRTKKMLLQDLFTIAPVKSVNGLDTGDVSLASTHLTDASTIGRILDINGYNSGNVNLGSSDLSDSSNIALVSDLGSSSQFTTEYNNPTTGTLQTEFEELARLVGNDIIEARVSLFAVQTTANNAMPTATANNTFATKTSLGAYTKSSDIVASHYTKTETDQKYSTQTSLGNYTKSTDIVANHYTKTEVDTLVQQNSGTGSSVFNSNHLVAQSASIATSLSTDTFNASGNASVGGNLTALGQLASLRAIVGDGTSSGVGSNATLHVDGNANITGSLVANSLEVLGSTTIKNTQVVEVSDDFVEINKGATGPTGTTSGIQVNRSVSNKAEISWDDTASIWQTKVGNSLASLRANTIEYANSYVLADLPTASSHAGMFAYETANTQAVYSNGTKWSSLIDSDQMGTTTQFDSAFTNALT